MMLATPDQLAWLLRQGRSAPPTTTTTLIKLLSDKHCKDFKWEFAFEIARPVHFNRKDKTKQVNQHKFQLLIWTFWSWAWTCWTHHHHQHHPLSETEVKRIISVLNDCAVHNHRWTVNVYCVQASIEFHLMHSNKFSEEMRWGYTGTAPAYWDTADCTGPPPGHNY